MLCDSTSTVLLVTAIDNGKDQNLNHTDLTRLTGLPIIGAVDYVCKTYDAETQNGVSICVSLVGL